MGGIMPGNKKPGPKTVEETPPANKEKRKVPIQKPTNPHWWKSLVKYKKDKKKAADPKTDPGSCPERPMGFGKHPGSSSNPEPDAGSSSNEVTAAEMLLLQAPRDELEPTTAMDLGPK